MSHELTDKEIYQAMTEAELDIKEKEWYDVFCLSIRAILVSHFRIPIRDICDKHNLRYDLQLDSLDMVDLLNYIEDLHGTLVDEDDPEIKKMFYNTFTQTISDLARVLAKCAVKRGLKHESEEEHI